MFMHEKNMCDPYITYGNGLLTFCNLMTFSHIYREYSNFCHENAIFFIECEK